MRALLADFTASTVVDLGIAAAILALWAVFPTDVKRETSLVTRLRRVFDRAVLAWTVAYASGRSVMAAFAADRRANIAILYAFVSAALVIGIGAGIDLSRAYAARQRLSQVATLTCQYSTRASIAQTANYTYSGSSGFSTYVAKVNAFATASLTTQHWTGTTPTATSGSTYFTATAATSSSVTPTNPVTEMSASIPTFFLRIVNVTSIPVHAKVACQTVSDTPQIVTSTNILTEGFETSCTTYCFTLPSGAIGTTTIPSSSTTLSAGYTGSSGAQWYIMGYCVEVDSVGVISSTVPEGSHSAELDCDNGSDSAGNSSITSKVYMPAGTYELRYYYRSRIQFSTYDPVYICGSAASDISWATATTSSYGALTNQINVYFDKVTSSSIPTHTTSDGQTLGGSNLIDTCGYSYTWIERSVTLTVTTPAYYWLSFAADGANDSYGGQIDDIRLCEGSCSGTPNDNFPSTWTAGTTLFEDTFETASLGSSWINAAGSSASSQVDIITPLLITPSRNRRYMQGSSYILPDGCNSSCGSSTRSLTRAFLLAPGYYQLSYDYVSLVTFPSTPATTGCLYAPTSSQVTTAGSTVAKNSTNLQSGSTYNTYYDNALIGVFMAAASQLSSPSISTGFTTSNPLIDSCFYYNDGTTSGYVQNRTQIIKISKTNYYYLTFYTGGTGTGPYTGAIDDVILSVVSSPYTSQSPQSAIPVAAPQIGASLSYVGFSFTVFDPFSEGS